MPADDDVALFSFTKERASQIHECVGQGKPIPTGKEDGWTMVDQLQTAAALVFTAGTFPDHEGKSIRLDDSLAAITFMVQLTEHVVDGTYEVDWKDTVVGEAKGSYGAWAHLFDGVKGDKPKTWRSES